jgi:hypothetical protein
MIPHFVKIFMVLFSLFWSASTITTAALAGEISSADTATFQKVISGQIAAFRNDNAEAAFAYASPSIQQTFRDPSIFISMVKQTYLPVYRPLSYEFGEAGIQNGIPVQLVKILGPKGFPWDALYTFEQQSDGSWRISGVYLYRQKGASA